MIKEFNFNKKNFQAVGAQLLEEWKKVSNKVMILRSEIQANEIRDFYENFCNKFGKLHYFAEDVSKGNRDNQRTGSAWMEVRYDPKIPDAYRHSANAQPMHTDGSYISNFPNASLMCCIANSDHGGETTFLAIEDLIKVLKDKKPDLLKKLESFDVMHERSGDKRQSKIIYKNNNQYNINWNYYCVSEKNDREILEMKEEFFLFLQTSEEIDFAKKKVKLTPGDAVTWKDNEILHGRNSFSADSPSERFLWKCAVDIGSNNKII